jgi:hypothetical protein
MLVETGFVERQCIQKRRLGGWQDVYLGTLENLARFCCRALACHRTPAL